MSWEILMVVLVIALVATLVAVVFQTNIDEPAAEELAEPVTAQPVPELAVFEPVEQPDPDRQAIEPAAVVIAATAIDQIEVDQSALDDPAPTDTNLASAITTSELFETVGDEESASPVVESPVDEPTQYAAAPLVADVTGTQFGGDESRSELIAEADPAIIEAAEADTEVAADPELNDEPGSSAIEPALAALDPELVAPPIQEPVTSEFALAEAEPIADSEPASAPIQSSQEPIELVAPPIQEPVTNDSAQAGAEPVSDSQPASAPIQSSQEPIELVTPPIQEPVTNEFAQAEAELIADSEPASAPIQSSQEPIELVAPPIQEPVTNESAQAEAELIANSEPASAPIESAQNPVELIVDPVLTMEPTIATDPAPVVTAAPIDMEPEAVPEPEEPSIIQPVETSSSEDESLADATTSIAPTFDAQTETAELFAPPEMWTDSDALSGAEPSPDSESSSNESESSSNSE